MAASASPAGFQTAVGWNPADVGPGWTFYRLLPVSIQAYRGYDEIPGRQLLHVTFGSVLTIGKDAKGAVHQAGQAYSKAGKDIGHGASKTVKDVGQAMKESADRTGKQIKGTGK